MSNNYPCPGLKFRVDRSVDGWAYTIYDDEHVLELHGGYADKEVAIRAALDSSAGSCAGQGEVMKGAEMIETGYKLTDADGCTKGNGKGRYHWTPGEWHEAPTLGPICNNENTGFHYYSSPHLAVMMNPAHGCYDLKTAQLWSCKVEDAQTDGTKSKARRLRLIERVELPRMTLEQRIYCAIQCMLLSGWMWRGRAEWVRWAEGWISGADRTRESARRTHYAAARYAAAYAATEADAYAYAAAAACAATIATASAEAEAAVWATSAAAAAGGIDIAAIAEQACRWIDPLSKEQK
jgi:hypothetical protein